MKALKTIGLVLLGLIVIYVGWAAMSPKTMDLTRSIEINRDKNTVYAMVNDFNQFKKWNPWSLTDPVAKSEITGTGTQIGDAWVWDGEKIGKGSLTHVVAVPGEMISNKLNITAPFKSTADDNWKFEEKDGKTIVTWNDKSEDPLPFFMRPMMSMMMGGQLEDGLKNLKKMAESMPAMPSPDSTATSSNIPADQE